MARAGHLSFSPRYVDREVESFLYPSYMFVLSPSQQWYHLVDLDGIIGIVGVRSDPDRDREPWRSSYLDKSVERMMSQADANGRVPAPPRIVKSRFLRGDRVRVLNGVFRDCLGLFDYFRDGRSRIQLDLLGATVTMNDSDLVSAGGDGFVGRA
jgi:transcription antitermination factor NusG